MSDQQMRKEPSGTMKMRWLTFLLLTALAVPAGVSSQGANRSAGGGTKPAIEILNTVHDFGDIYKQDKYVHAFSVRNRGNADLVIEDVKPG